MKEVGAGTGTWGQEDHLMWWHVASLVAALCALLLLGWSCLCNACVPGKQHYAALPWHAVPCCPVLFVLPLPTSCLAFLLPCPHSMSSVIYALLLYCQPLLVCVCLCHLACCVCTSACLPCPNPAVSLLVTLPYPLWLPQPWHAALLPHPIPNPLTSFSKRLFVVGVVGLVG